MSHEQPCRDLQSHQLETAKRMYRHATDIETTKNSIVEARVAIHECLEDIREAVDLTTQSRLNIARQDERLKTGQQKFKTHDKWLVALTVCYISVVVTLASVYGPAILKTLKVTF